MHIHCIATIPLPKFMQKTRIQGAMRGRGDLRQRTVSPIFHSLYSCVTFSSKESCYGEYQPAPKLTAVAQNQQRKTRSMESPLYSWERLLARTEHLPLKVLQTL